eukprot:Hpha_TRINITY_DN16018_c2_g1::TRINITY_DN16018_c2_g1_i1::g.118155::m.118155
MGVMSKQRVVCVSGLPIDVKTRTVVEAVERETERRVLKSMFVWNSGVALMEVDGLRELPSEKVLLTWIKPEKGRCPVLQLSDKKHVDEPSPGSVVNVRCYAIDPERDVRRPNPEDRAMYKKTASVWTRDGEGGINDLLQMAMFVSSKAGILFDQFAAPLKAFSKTKPAEGAAPRLYAQIFIKFGSLEEAKQAHLADGEIVQVRGLDCVVRVEGLSSKQRDIVSGIAHVTNPYLRDDGSNPPPLEEDSSPDEGDSPASTTTPTSPRAGMPSRRRACGSETSWGRGRAEGRRFFAVRC